MGIFSRTKNKNKLMLVLDIRSSSVGGALFEAQKSGIPKIIFSVREPVIIENKISFERLLSSTLKSLEIVASKICIAGVGAPDEIFCVLSSPWYVSQTRIINFSKNTPFIFTAKLADNLIQKEVNFLKEEHLIKYSNASDSMQLIELKNIKTMLNGYDTIEPLGKKANEVEMTVFISSGEKSVLEKIEKTVIRHFHDREIKFSSFAMASFAVMRDLRAEEENFLLIDIGGELTDIFLVKKNALRESVSFPLGRNFIIRETASALNCDINEAKSFVSLYKDGHMAKSTARKLNTVMEKLKTRWLKNFQESLANLSDSIFIPANIYLTADNDLADFFSETIKNEQYSQYALTESKFKIVFLDRRMLHGMAVFKENAVRDVCLTVDSIYVNRFLTR